MQLGPGWRVMSLKCLPQKTTLTQKNCVERGHTCAGQTSDGKPQLKHLVISCFSKHTNISRMPPNCIYQTGLRTKSNMRCLTSQTSSLKTCALSPHPSDVYGFQLKFPENKVQKQTKICGLIPWCFRTETRTHKKYDSNCTVCTEAGK